MSDSLGTGEQTAQLPADRPPEISPLARVAAGLPPRPVIPADPDSPLALTSAADAMRDEEVERTRLFIRMGWLLTLAAMATIPFVDAPPVMNVTFVVGLLIGMVVSFHYHQRFADPKKYTERSLVSLAVLCVINGHIGVLFYGAFTAAPLMVMVGIHFVARTEAERVARWIFGVALACYAGIAVTIVTGAIDDPGVFASERPISRAVLLTATVFVLGTFWLAYHTARTFRLASLAAIEDMQRATRLTSHRDALMEELRAELERALRVGGPGRYTGQRVGAFELGNVLGRGAMGEVYEATHAETGEPAALKLLRRELLADRTQVARFLREARVAGALDSPHVVRVLDASPPDAAPPWLAMERLHGHTLGETLRTEARLSGETVLGILRDVGRGLDAAAAAGIVHRDLKPQNVFRSADGAWRLLDFGVATFTDDTGTLTHGEVVGTPHYMAPEQAQGKRVDIRADLFALAAIAYRCLVGRHPFTATDTPSLLYAVVHRMPPRPGEIADLPADLDAWFALALAKDPAARFPSGAALAGAFEAALAGLLSAETRKRAASLLAKHPWEGA
ncbi:MAG: serine/threonine protein kinase [Myxococcales bacterium]|nr:serine/threonine protein kinase [Myxococcales bacterium]